MDLDLRPGFVLKKNHGTIKEQTQNLFEKAYNSLLTTYAKEVRDEKNKTQHITHFSLSHWKTLITQCNGT